MQKVKNKQCDPEKEPSVKTLSSVKRPCSAGYSTNRVTLRTERRNLQTFCQDNAMLHAGREEAHFSTADINNTWDEADLTSTKEEIIASSELSSLSINKKIEVFRI